VLPPVVLEEEFRAFLHKRDRFPPNYGPEQRNELRAWFEFFWTEWKDSWRGDGEEAANLETVSFADVRREMEKLAERTDLRSIDAALLCAWVWSLGGETKFCSSDAQKLYGESGRNLNANHFNRLAKRGAHGRHGGDALLRWLRKGVFELTQSGREQGERLARRFLFAPLQETSPRSREGGEPAPERGN